MKRSRSNSSSSMKELRLIALSRILGNGNRSKPVACTVKSCVEVGCNGRGTSGKTGEDTAGVPILHTKPRISPWTYKALITVCR